AKGGTAGGGVCACGGGLGGDGRLRALRGLQRLPYPQRRPSGPRRSRPNLPPPSLPPRGLLSTSLPPRGLLPTSLPPRDLLPTGLLPTGLPPTAMGAWWVTERAPV